MTAAAASIECVAPRSNERGNADGKNSPGCSENNMGALTERRYPLAAGLVAGAVYYFVAPEFPVKPENAASLFSAIISVAAIAVGFLATASSILLSIDRKPIIFKLKEVG